MEFPLGVSRAWSEAVELGGRIKVAPEDFVVDELMDENFSGEGEHLYLKIRKTNQNTHWVAEQLARMTRVRIQDVGFAGRKDRHAVTTQWFSLPFKDVIDDVSAIQGCELLDVQRHIRKLRPGDHLANFFRIRICELRGDAGLRNEILAKIEEFGFPNYFGVQRFGRDGANLDRGWQALASRQRLKGRQSGMYLSALRSWLFNQVLERHMRAENWPAICSSADQVWTGPLWGRGRSAPSELEASVEAEVVQECAELCHYLEFSGLNQERRSLLARPRQFKVVEHSAEDLTLEFELATGQFATELLAEIMGGESP